MSKNYRAELTGVFGDPVDENPTGVMTEAAYRACGLNYRYIIYKVDSDGFDAAMRAVHPLNMKGINLTMPHKITVLPYLDDMSEAARLIGAVNTVIVQEDGSLFGENTDGKGFVQALSNAGVSPAGKNVVILGAGGAAKAIAVECALAGARRITIINRTGDKAAELAALVAANTKAEAEGTEWQPHHPIPADTDILINATSIGFAPQDGDRPDIDYGTITSNMAVSDVVFNPAQTRFLEAAQSQGARTINGLGMLACQGALNFTLWTGQEAPLQLMEQTLAEELNEG